MRIIMVSTPMCSRCRRIAPVLESYCKEHDIAFLQIHLQDASKEVVDILTSKRVTQAPAFLIYKDNDEVLVMSGDDIMVKLESLKL